MSSIIDFNDPDHRIQSASAAFQKGLYHLFILKKRETTDVFAQVLRLYQCLFQLCLTELLLDSDYDLNKVKIQPRLRNFCQNPEQPTRREIDPAAIVDHTTFEKKKWRGFRKGHPLEKVSKCTLELYARVVDARHNLVYRPFMLDNLYEDCTLIDLLKHLPKTSDVEYAYQDFIKATVDCHIVEQKVKPPTVTLEDLQSGRASRCAGYFLELLFMVYQDQRDNRPTETLLLAYARMLNPTHQQLLEEVREYRNQLLDVEKLIKVPGITILDEWQAGEL